MNKKCYAIFDKKANAYNNPFFMVNEPMAVRAVMGAVKDEKSELAMFPEDYALYELGDYDDVAGTITCDKTHPRMICALNSLKEIK